jgi:hypothetical protein
LIQKIEIGCHDQVATMGVAICTFIAANSFYHIIVKKMPAQNFVSQSSAIDHTRLATCQKPGAPVQPVLADSAPYCGQVSGWHPPASI